MTKCMKFVMVLFAAVILMLCNGCVLTKLVTVPIRFGGAAVSIVPVAGNQAHDVVDTTADQIDKAPF